MLSRRSFISGAIGSLVTTGRAFALGGYGAYGLWDAIMAMQGIEEGEGPLVNILVVRGCDKSGLVWTETRRYLGVLRIRWLPVYEGHESNKVFVAAALADKTSATLSRVVLDDDEMVDVGEEDIAAAMAQERIYSGRVARLLWESSGRPPAMPSYVYKDGTGRVKVIDGALRPERYLDLALEAG